MADTSSIRSSNATSPAPQAIHLADGGRDGAPAEFKPQARSLEDDQPTVISSRAASSGDASADVVMRILHGVVPPGERLGHFELLKYVGGGGMGKVFRAMDTRLARSVALKILSPEHAADPETVLRFQNEAQSAARLDHENIARVYYVGEDRGLHYIAFEFIDGVNVRDLVASRGPLPLAEAVSYILQVADALAHAAERNVVHRDIKPSNLLITPAGQAKLIDMGLARLREVDAGADLTASGVTLGTFDYISPEQARDPRHADVRSDIYSLGCTFFFMLTGRPPFVGGTMLQKLLQHQADQPPELRQFRPDLPDEVDRVLRRMLAKDPRQRYTTPSDLVNDLMVIANAAGLQPTVPGRRIWTVPAAPSVPSYYRHLPWIVSLLALLAIVVALDWLWPYMPGPAVPPSGPRPGEGEIPAASAKGPGEEGALPPRSATTSTNELTPVGKRPVIVSAGEKAAASGSAAQGELSAPARESLAPTHAGERPRASGVQHADDAGLGDSGRTSP